MKCKKKKKKTTECDKITVTYDVSTTQCEDSTIKSEKKIRELSTMTKVQSNVMFVLHNMRIVSLNVRKK